MVIFVNGVGLYLAEIDPEAVDYLDLLTHSRLPEEELVAWCQQYHAWFIKAKQQDPSIQTQICSSAKKQNDNIQPAHWKKRPSPS